MSADDIEDTGVPLPAISHVSTVGPSTLVVTWSEGRRAGEVGRVDVAPIIHTYKIFRPLRNNPKLFATARVGDGGIAVAWDGEDLEMSAELIEELAEQIMTPADFVTFMDRHNLTEDAIAAILGYSRRQIGYFKTTEPIPRVVALACKGYEKEREEKLREIQDAITVNYQSHQKEYPKVKITAG